ncbi:NusG domain II-containing protein [Anaerotignum lactatifermentans]|uniref:NusG domain II-containing protein n=1 Tax=Anaerotignum lactatifermentans TaxID=160404 RepID=A0ABS2G9V3_9FIRM|nr:NusG domain II-containing protein [Anaerotignum lactatifermentans]MBM6829050.1 NusG domain II-containing protein [Anaerotignum lactatifermentans]MBM6877343.1 NusG domain II-containing protein [Anaerotignum lactatifermentans]MBM6950713.1 NusG domain II-containing protein [Anaerotignum lactatifermentans]
MKRMDLILVFVVLAIAGAIYFFYTGTAETGAEAVITVDGEVYATMPLSKDDSLRVETETGYNIVEIQDGYAMVTEADCRDGICENHRKISKNGENIVCLPHKMVVEITGGEDPAADMVVG